MFLIDLIILKGGTANQLFARFPISKQNFQGLKFADEWTGGPADSRPWTFARADFPPAQGPCLGNLRASTTSKGRDSQTIGPGSLGIIVFGRLHAQASR